MSETLNRHQKKALNFLLGFMDQEERESFKEYTSSVYGEILGTKGLKAARFWFWRQFIRSLPGLVAKSIIGDISMLKNYLKIALRSIQRHKGFSFINLTGLAVGLAAFILIAIYVQYELSFDRYHENSNRIYRVIRPGRAVTPPPLGPTLMEEFPEVISAARIIMSQNVLVSPGEENYLEDKVYWADPETFDIFTIPFIKGNPKTSLTDPSAILLSESTARKYFGNKDPMEKILSIGQGRYDYKVSGVFHDMPPNSHFVMDVILPLTSYFQITKSDRTSWYKNYVYTYFLLQEGVHPESLENKFPAFIKKFKYKGSAVEGRDIPTWSAQPLNKIHLHSHLRQEIEAKNDVKYIFLFFFFFFLILFIACVNYMNLATARSTQRGKEVGMRKVVGAKRAQLMKQFLGESVAMALLSMMISIILVLIILPVFNRLVERQLSLNPAANLQLFFGLVVITIFAGLFAGSYPAVVISGFKPISVLRRAFTKSSKGSSLRNILVLMQFSITVILIFCTLIVREQLHFIKNTDMGYSKDQIITISVHDRAVRKNIKTIKTELLRSSDVLGVSTSDSLPNNIDTFTHPDWLNTDPDSDIAIYYNTADYDFIHLFGIKIVEGRNFSEDFPSDKNGAFLINEAAVKAAGWESPIGREIAHWRGDTGKIVGIIEDFHLHSLHSPIDPLYIFLDESDFSYISIKIKSASIPATIDYVKGIMKKFSPRYPFVYSFFDDLFEKAYKTEQRMFTIFGSFSILAIIIACLGLFGLISFATEQRTKEIGIRKVLGASVQGIVGLLITKFIKWVLMANIIAWPLAYFAMNKWLQNFAYRTDMSIWIFIISGLTALAIALLTVSYQSIKAATANPVDSLRYE